MKNQRQFFRVRLFEEPVLLHTDTRYHQGIIRDLSGNGISFYLHEPAEFEWCVLEFQLKGTAYTLDAKKVREEKTTHGEYVYACTFLHVPEKVQSSILAILLRLDAIRQKK